MVDGFLNQFVMKVGLLGENVGVHVLCLADEIRDAFLTPWVIITRPSACTGGGGTQATRGRVQICLPVSELEEYVERNVVKDMSKFDKLSAVAS
jgi:hypothetical protein